MEAVLAFRTELVNLGTDAIAVPSLNDIIIKASAVALRENPNVNSSYVDGGVEIYDRVNVGFAVTAPGTLIVPVVFDADLKGPSDIAAETSALVARVRTRSIRPDEVTGGTFTVSNLGMFGIRNFDAIVNSPQAAILSVGAIGEEPVARNGQVVVRNVAHLTLTCDHRIIYGADAARYLSRLRDLLEQPVALMDSSTNRFSNETVGLAEGKLDRE